MRELTTDLGTRITLGAEIGGGGEGLVFEIVGKVGYIAKIYHKPPSLELVSKLHALRKVTEIEDVSKIAAIPKSLLKNNEGKVVGFYMKHIQGGRPIHEVYGPKSRKIHLSDWDFRHLVALAKNVALGFARLHKHKIIVGDVNENSILVSSKCLARFIDTDSFQIRDNDKVYRCKVGVVDYTAPELIGKNFTTTNRTNGSDNFALAVLLYQILMAGWHPFWLNDSDRQEAIKQSAFVFRNREVFTKTKTVRIIWSSLPIEIKNFFESAFTEGPSARPSSFNWYQILDEFSAQLKSHCGNKAHFSLGKKCPWCDLELKTGISFFSKPSDGQKTEMISSFDDFDRKVQKIRAELLNDPYGASFKKFPNPSSKNSKGTTHLIKSSIFDNVAKNTVYLGIGMSVVFILLSKKHGISSSFQGGDRTVFFLFCVLFGATIGFCASALLADKFSKRRKLYVKLKKDFKIKSNAFFVWVKDFDRKISVSSSKVQEYYKRMSKLKDESTTWKEYFKREKEKNSQILVEEKLSRIPVSSKNFPAVHDQYLQKIRGANIRFASDLEYRRLMRIYGIGDVTASEMLSRKRAFKRKISAEGSREFPEKIQNQIKHELLKLNSKLKEFEIYLPTFNNLVKTDLAKAGKEFKRGQVLAQELADIIADLDGLNNFHSSGHPDLVSLNLLANETPGNLKNSRSTWPNIP